MISLRLWRLSKSSLRRNTRGSGNARSTHYSPSFLLRHICRSTPWTEIVFRFCLNGQNYDSNGSNGGDFGFWKSEWSQWFYWGPLSVTALTTHSLCAATRHFGDRSMAATWSKELLGSHTAGPCLSSTLWRATWGKDDERPHLFWTRIKRSAPSPHFQCTLICTLQFLSLFIAFLWRWEQNKNKQGPSFHKLIVKWNETVCFKFVGALKNNLYVLILLCRLGCPGFTKPEYQPTPVEKGVSKSLFFPDEAINRHPRFRWVSCFEL